MRDDRYLGGVLCHYGVLGMKWGVRRSPEQLGGGGSGSSKVDKFKDHAKMLSECVHSEKGFYLHPNKLNGFCLREGAKHSKEFYNVGYKPTDYSKLFADIENGFDMSKKIDERPSVFDGKMEFSIPMMLGVTTKQTFRTTWKFDVPDGAPRFTGAHRDSSLEED